MTENTSKAWIWCGRCNRCFLPGEKRKKISMQNSVTMCAYEDCTGDPLLVGRYWRSIRQRYPEFPEKPERYVVYSLPTKDESTDQRKTRKGRSGTQLLDKGLKMLHMGTEKEGETVGGCLAKIALLTKENEVARKLNEELSAKLIETQKQLELIKMERTTIQKLLTLEQQGHGKALKT